jgi:hypothetical protein
VLKKVFDRGMVKNGLFLGLYPLLSHSFKKDVTGGFSLQ